MFKIKKENENDDEMKLKLSFLRQRQALPLQAKINLSTRRIREWYEHYSGDVYIAFSGGLDSTVLLHLVRQIYPNIIGVFSDTGLEYPEIRDFVKSKSNIEIVKPKMQFKEVIEKFGYPVISKKVARGINDLQNASEKNKNRCNLLLTGKTKENKDAPSFKMPKKWLKLISAPFKVSEKCCHYIKKSPLDKYSKKNKKYPYVGVMASESNMREKQYLKNGCNFFGKIPISMPMAFWTREDILEYIKINNLPYCSVYGDIVKDENGKWQTTGEQRTGCMFCMFGVHLEKEPNRFQRMKVTHPSQYKFCMEVLKISEILDFIGVPYN